MGIVGELQRPVPPNLGPLVLTTWSEGAAGLLLIVAGAIPWVAAPGYPTSGYAAIETVPSTAVLLLGIVLLARSLARYRTETRSASAREIAGTTHRFSTPATLSVVGGAFLLLIVMSLLSAGVVPGWYLPSTGARDIPIVGCGGVVAHPAPGFPDGFPPGARVSLRWTSANATRVTVAIYQSSPNSARANSGQNTVALETGTSGGSAFLGEGGAFWVDSNSTGGCPRGESVLVSWSYPPRLA
jgi:hypothetical protein